MNARRWKLTRLLSLAWSWIHAEGVGLTICRLLGHRETEPELLNFQRWLNVTFEHPLDSDVWDIICSRCGGTTGRILPPPGYTPSPARREAIVRLFHAEERTAQERAQ